MKYRIYVDRCAIGESWQRQKKLPVFVVDDGETRRRGLVVHTSGQGKFVCDLENPVYLDPIGSAQCRVTCWFEFDGDVVLEGEQHNGDVTIEGEFDEDNNPRQSGQD